MLSSQSRLLALVSVVLLSACAQKPHRAFEAESRSAVRATDVVVAVPQNELNAQIIVANSSAATAQFGLIGALVGAAIDSGINASRASTAEEQVRPLRDKLLGYDFDAQLKADLQRELAAIEWLKAGDVAVRKTAVDDKARSALAINTKADGVLVVQTAYELAPDFSNLRLTSHASLVPPSRTTNGKESKQERHDRQQKAGRLDGAKYYNSIVVEAPLDGATATLEDNRQKWAQGDLLARTLRAQVTELARLVALDLAFVPPSDANAAPASPVAAGPATPSRSKDGTIKSTVAQSAIPQAPAPAPVAVAQPEAAPAEAAPAVAEPAAMPTAAPAAKPEATAPAPTL